jgi:hypothetical protein
MEVVSFTPQPLYCPWKNSRYPLDRSWVGHRAGLDAVVKRKIPRPCRETNSDRPAHSLVIKLSELLPLLLSWIIIKKKQSEKQPYLRCCNFRMYLHRLKRPTFITGANMSCFLYILQHPNKHVIYYGKRPLQVGCSCNGLPSLLVVGLQRNQWKHFSRCMHWLPESFR